MYDFILALLLIVFACIGFSVSIIALIRFIEWIYKVGESYIKIWNYLKNKK